MSDGPATPPADPLLFDKQLELYAQELSALYREERAERQRLAEEKLVLEYRLKELAALNNLFHLHLEYQERLEQALRELAARLKEVLASAAAAASRQQLQQLLELAQGALEPPPPRPSSHAPGASP